MIMKALEYDPLCLDAYVQFANYFMNKGDKDNAVLMLKKIVEEIKAQTGDETIFDEEDVDIVPYPLRLTVSKLLIEVLLWDDALYILNGLYDEDSSNLDVSYMLAFVNFKLEKYAQVNDLLKEL